MLSDLAEVAPLTDARAGTQTQSHSLQSRRCLLNALPLLLSPSCGSMRAATRRRNVSCSTAAGCWLIFFHALSLSANGCEKAPSIDVEVTNEFLNVCKEVC